MFARRSSGMSSAMTYQSFKPKFPLDPFADPQTAMPASEPWILDTNDLALLPQLQAQRNVVLIIGDPTQPALEHLFHSFRLSSSLLIVATHRPPQVPPDACPTVRVLHLLEPLAIAEQGSSRLLKVLGWGERIARTWRQNGGPRVEVEYEAAEPQDQGHMRPQSQRVGSTYGIRTSRSTSNTPNSSQRNLLRPTASSSVLSRPTSLYKAANNSSKTLARQRKTPDLSLTMTPRYDPAQRTFDAVLNFLPSGLQEKHTLKGVILVTTISRSYLVAAAPLPSTPTFNPSGRSTPNSAVSLPIAKLQDGNRSATEPPRKRWSFLRPPPPPHSFSLDDVDRSAKQPDTSSVTTQADASARHSRIVHILPSSYSPAGLTTSAMLATSQGQPRLVRSIESFILSVCSQPPLDIMAMPSAMRTPDMQQNSMSNQVLPYLIPATALADVLSVSVPLSLQDVEGDDTSSAGSASISEWTLMDLLLCGALDPAIPITPTSSRPELGKQKAVSSFPTRAWVAGVYDIVLRSQNAQPRPTVQSQLQPHPIPQPQPQLYPQPQPQPILEPPSKVISVRASLDKPVPPTPPEFEQLTPAQPPQPPESIPQKRHSHSHPSTSPERAEHSTRQREKPQESRRRPRYDRHISDPGAEKSSGNGGILHRLPTPPEAANSAEPGPQRISRTTSDLLPTAISDPPVNMTGIGSGYRLSMSLTSSVSLPANMTGIGSGKRLSMTRSPSGSREIGDQYHVAVQRRLSGSGVSPDGGLATMRGRYQATNAPMVYAEKPKYNGSDSKRHGGERVRELNTEAAQVHAQSSLPTPPDSLEGSEEALVGGGTGGKPLGNVAVQAADEKKTTRQLRHPKKNLQKDLYTPMEKGPHADYALGKKMLRKISDRHMRGHVVVREKEKGKVDGYPRQLMQDERRSSKVMRKPPPSSRDDFNTGVVDAFGQLSPVGEKKPAKWKFWK